MPAGKVPKDTTPTISTASLPVLARRFRADPHEVGRIEGIGLDSWELGAASTRASVGREPVTGRRLWERLWERRLELGANTYRVLVHPTSTNPILGVLGVEACFKYRSVGSASSWT